MISQKVSYSLWTNMMQNLCLSRFIETENTDVNKLNLFIHLHVKIIHSHERKYLFPASMSYISNNSRDT